MKAFLWFGMMRWLLAKEGSELAVFAGILLMVMAGIAAGYFFAQRRIVSACVILAVGAFVCGIAGELVCMSALGMFFLHARTLADQYDYAEEEENQDENAIK